MDGRRFLHDLLEAVRRDLGLTWANAWARHARFVSQDESAAIFAFSDGVARSRIEPVCLPVVRRALRRLTNRNLRVVCAVDPALFGGTAPRPPAHATPPAPSGAARGETFDTFVVGACNQIACRAARRFAQAGDRELQTLLFAAPAGCGKTHLLRAVHHLLLSARQTSAVLLLSTARFHQQFVYALRHGLLEPFRRKYRTADVLLFDDVHLLASKPRTQQEFLHTLDALLQAGRRVALTSDRAAREIDGLSRPLQARLRAAVEVRLERPDPATRLAYLRSRAMAVGFDCPDEALAALADQVSTQFHDLARCLESVRARGGDPREGAREAVDALRREWGREVTPVEIAQRVGVQLGIKAAELYGDRRTQPLVLGRQICFYLGRRHTPLTLGALGHAFGKRDHATVHVAVRRLEDRMRRDQTIDRLVRKLDESLGHTAGADPEEEGAV